jgi:Carboxypeptidase regulatory-like domain
MRSLKLLVLVSLLLSVTFSWSQTGTSTIRGTVTDPTGGVVPGATLTLTNVETNAVRTTKSNDTGSYVFDLITPAEYRLEVQAKGFKKQVVDKVEALIGKPTEANVTLGVGAATEVVEVVASSQQALINTQDATLGNTFDSLQITQLPLEARNLVDLLSLQPGSTREGYVTGARADQANVTLDGVDINNAQTGNAEIPRSTNSLFIGSLNSDRGDITNGPVLRLNSEAIEEFRVTTANGNANQGRSSGSQVNLATKGGTNNWHGAASEFYRSRGFTANDWFNNHASPQVARPPLQRNTFEGALGGPILKNKAFFFYDYAGRHDASSQSVARTVPLPTLGQGIINYQYCANPSCNSIASLNLAQNQSAYSATGINATALAALAAASAQFPNNDVTTGDQINTGGFRFNAPTPTRLNSHVAKLDFNLTSTQTAFIRANVIYDHQTLPQWLPGTPSPLVWSHPWGLAVGHTWTINNQWVNSLRYGFTRQSFTNGGDSTANDIDFRFVFQQTGELHTVSRVTPVHNFTDDVSWIHGNHTVQFGANVRLISNQRNSLANAFDFAEANPSFYAGAGAPVPDAFQTYLDANSLPGAGTDPNHSCDSGPVISCREIRDAATAIIGRFTEFQANFTFAKDGTLLPAGTPAIRDFATQAYSEYVQDTWKIRPSLTLTLGLAYSLERPVYETHGFETQPSVPLGPYYAQRVAAGNQGTNFVDPITIVSSGPANGGKPLYNWDKNNFQPRIALAWSPDGGKTALRGGFAVTNDYYGQALAVDFDLGNTVGYTQRFENHANTFDIGGSSKPLGPLFTGFGQDVRSMVPSGGGTVPTSLQLPVTPTPLDGLSNFGERIERSLDSALHAPTEYVWNFTIERQLSKGGVFSASYIGRMGRSLLARRDVAAFNNLRDPQTGVDWYTAGTALEKLRAAGVDISQVPSQLPAQINQYFDDMFPPQLAQLLNNYEGLPCDPAQNQGGFDCNWTNAQAFLGYQTGNVGFFNGNDYTDVQAEIDNALAANGLPIQFMQPQYGALSTWATIGNSNYNALALSFRQRLKSVSLDFNYTWSHSLDDASGLQSETGFGNFQTNGAFIVNPLRQRDSYANSDFDVRHSINADVVWQLPFGKGQAFMGNAGRAADAVLGGWQLTGIFRWNTGLPTGISPFDESQWATNWDVQSDATPTKAVHTCPNKPANAAPKLFGSCGTDQVYQSFRNAYPGEAGPRNIFRFPGYVDLDLGLGKTWKMPWSEGQQLQLRWEVFNVTNTQHLTGIADFAVAQDPGLNQLSAPPDWANFTQVQGQPRVMQIGARYSF